MLNFLSANIQNWSDQEDRAAIQTEKSMRIFAASGVVCGGATYGSVRLVVEAELWQWGGY
ncbi:hypothetical protein GCM10023321_78860 [Pseudonocardia eucalypti]|uniref:Uncharacterized protein n=1 Tax=Pseudonocardia eucalypti TaxID=648755 RepID=A0ABP9RC30_9PSEU